MVLSTLAAAQQGGRRQFVANELNAPLFRFEYLQNSFVISKCSQQVWAGGIGKGRVMRKQVSLTRWFVVTAALIMLGVTGWSQAQALETPMPDASRSYRVTDVAVGDQLNVRRFAGVEQDAVGTLSPDARDIAVTGSWEEIGSSVWWELVYPGTEIGTGWVNARFLIQQNSAPVDGTEAVTDFPLACAGTEPFWSLMLDADRAQYSLAGEEETTFEASPWANARGRAPGFQFAVRLRDADSEGAIVVVRPQGAFCSDGMSDIRFPFYGTLIHPDGRVLGGCCRRDVR